MPSLEEIISESNNVTIITAKKTIHSLSDYLHIKGLYLTARLTPSLNPFSDEINLNFILNFLNSTQLNRCLFWKTMSNEQKMKLIKTMAMRDEKNMHLTTTSTYKNADVYVLLSGKAQVVTINKNSDGHGKKNTQTIRMGGVFGSLDTFNSEMESSEVVVTTTVTIPSGTVLRLKFQDFYDAKYADKNSELFESLGDLTPQDLAVRVVQRQGYSKLTQNMNQFLRKCNLIPTNGLDTAFKYICEGSRGRTIEASKREQEVLFILQGEVKVVLERSIIDVLKEEQDRLHDGKNDNFDSDEEDVGEGGTITLKRQGEPALNIPMTEIPLAVLEAGSILLFDEDMFSPIITQSNATNSNTHSSVPSNSNNLLNSLLHDEDHETEEPVGLPPLPDPQQRKERENGKICTNYIPHMTIVFEKPTTYLSIPLKRIKNCLQTESYQSNLDIRGELRAICLSLAERIKKLKPFLLASKVITTKNRKPRIRPPKIPTDKIYNGDIESGKSDLQGTYSGINLNTLLNQQHPLCGSSVSGNSSIGTSF